MKRDEGDAPVRLSFGLKKAGSGSDEGGQAGPSSSTPTTKPSGITLAKTNSLKMSAKPANPLKGNVFKSASKSTPATASKRPQDDSVLAAQKLMLEERKQRKLERDALARPY